MKTGRQVSCPTCQKQHNWNASKPWSPFCSERCRLIDLGAWAAEQHRIPGNEVIQLDEQSSEASS